VPVLGLAVALVAAALGASACSSAQDGGAAGASPAVSGTPLPDPEAEVTNGVLDRPVDTVLEQAVATLAGLRSYRVTGSPTQGDPLDLVFATGTALTRPDATPAADAVIGRGVRGTLTRDRSQFEILAVDGSVYVRGDLRWLADVVTQDARRTVGSKWLLLPPAAATRLETLTDADAFAQAVLLSDGEVESIGVAEIDGRPALGIRSLQTRGTVWVAGTGPVLPLQVEREGATERDGVLTFSEFDERVVLRPPRADNVVAVTATPAPAPQARTPATPRPTPRG
jgi:hypothetical protein